MSGLDIAVLEKMDINGVHVYPNPVTDNINFYLEKNPWSAFTAFQEKRFCQVIFFTATSQ
ncbi:MAG TPA: hypothetical protein VD905_09610 [Flavobacteriales bacterium]|nr:hypothetical protein [Flavobacteriales bacterium]